MSFFGAAATPKTEGDGEKETSADFQPPRDRPRSCTDCICLIMIIACWVAMTLVGFAAIGIIKYEYVTPGNPMRLIHPVDYQGRICGVDDGVKNKPLGYYLPTTAVLCVESCPTTNDINIFYCKDAANVGTIPLFWQAVVDGDCMYSVETEEVANRCIFSGSASELYALLQQDPNADQDATKTYNSLNKYGGWFTEYMGDIMTLRGYVFGFGLGVSVGISFLYLYFLRIPGLMFTVVWTAVLSVLAACVVITILLRNLYQKWEEDALKSNTEVITLKVFTWFCMALCVLYACLVVVLRKRIELAIGIVKEAGKAMASMPSLIFIPVVQAAGFVMFLIPWFIYMLYLASSGTVETVSKYNQYSQTTVTFNQFVYDDNTKYALLYLVFCWFWTSQFIIALGQLVLAVAVVCWYFTKDKSTVGNGTVLWATRVSLCYNAGTAAFGSLLIAAVSTVRVVLAYIQRQTDMHRNRFTDAIVCCISCCLWCLEKFMKFINKNAYIQVAIYGYDFCKATRSVFFLLIRNALRLAAVSMVTNFVTLIGKILIPSLTTLICYLAIIYGNPDLSANINGIIAPMVTVFLLSYFISCKFNELFSMAIETILLCYIADEELFPAGERYAEKELGEVVSKTQAACASANVHHDAGVKAELVK